MNQWAFWAIWIFVFVVPWENVVVIPNLGTVAKLVGFVSGGVGLLAVVASGRVRAHPLLGWALAFVAWSWASFFWTLEAEATFRRALTYTQLLIASWLIYQFSVKEETRKALMWAYVLGAWVSVLSTLRVYNLGIEVAYQRFAAEGFDPNDFSFYLNMAILMAWYLGLHSGSRFSRLISWGLIPFAIFAILLTASRAGALGMALALIFVLFSTQRLSWQWRVIGLTLVLGFGGLILTKVPESSFVRLSTLGEELTAGTLNDRTVIWAAGFRVFFDHSLLGTGVGTFRYAVEQYLGVRAAPHNVFLAVAVEGGIVGLLLWLGMLVAAFGWVLQYRGPGSDRFFWVVVLGVLLLALMSLNFEWRKVTWLTFALAAAYARHSGVATRLRTPGSAA